MVEHSAVNRGVVGSSPTRGVLIRRDSADLFSSVSTTLPMFGSERLSCFLCVNLRKWLKASEMRISYCFDVIYGKTRSPSLCGAST